MTGQKTEARPSAKARPRTEAFACSFRAISASHSQQFLKLIRNEKYVCVQQGLLHSHDKLVLQTSLKLLCDVEKECDDFQRRRMISALFEELQSCREGCELILNVLSSILSHTYYILSPKELQVLESYRSVSNVKEGVFAVIYHGVLRSIRDVQYVRTTFIGIDENRYAFVE